MLKRVKNFFSKKKTDIERLCPEHVIKRIQAITNQKKKKHINIYILDRWTFL